MEIMTREELAALLRMTPQALSNHIMRGSREIPPCIRVGGRNKWIKSVVLDWLQDQIAPPRPAGHRGPGRPRKGEEKKVTA
jgi:hypothetical protein